MYGDHTRPMVNTADTTGTVDNPWILATPPLWFVPSFEFISPGLPLDLVLAMASMGLSFALVPAVLWPAVTYLVPERLAK